MGPRSWRSWSGRCTFRGWRRPPTSCGSIPHRRGFTIKGHGRTSGRLFVPDLAFGEHIQMGENIFFFMGEMQECYVIYWLDAPVVAE